MTNMVDAGKCCNESRFKKVRRYHCFTWLCRLCSRNSLEMPYWWLLGWKRYMIILCNLMTIRWYMNVIYYNIHTSWIKVQKIVVHKELFWKIQVIVFRAINYCISLICLPDCRLRPVSYKACFSLRAFNKSLNPNANFIAKHW